ncbi:MAG: HDOD domain-containing protein [Desulfobacterales bacterium]|nr:HDOD domain-containing protein [Desulfobacterales bacterium]MDD4072723.1 HDOD domain-containing protein [Desulfobacterales bacterium]MDD4392290.1 HDOD domain-containing protein [Desulfobacterales bacterium]
MTQASSHQDQSIPLSVEHYIARMPRLSTTMAKVVAICNNSETSANDLNRVISLDPVLTGQVLKLINSAYYGLRSEATSLTRAIIMLGVNTVKNIALSSVILKNTGQKHLSDKAFMDRFWAHSLNVGVTAKTLAAMNQIPIASREQFFVAGLLHDLGKIPLHAASPEAYGRLSEYDIAGQARICHDETTTFGIHHCTIGQIIADKWALGKKLSDSLAFHHDPDQADEKTRTIVSFVAIANIFSIAFKQNLSEGNFFEIQIPNGLLNQAGVHQLVFSDLKRIVSEEIEKAKIFLDIIQKG